MAKTDNLTDYLTDLADGIRAKKGTTDPINPQDFRKEIESISGGGGESGEGYKYYLLDWRNISDLDGYDKNTMAETVKQLDYYYYTAYVMPSKSVMPGIAVFNDFENWGVWLYKAMRWKSSETSFAEAVGNSSPKQVFEFFAADMPILGAMAEKMVECTKEEFYALTE